MTAPLPPSSTLVDLLLHRANAAPDATAYTFLVDGDREEESLDYEGFARRVLSIAGLLQQAGARGEPVLLLFPPGLDYVAAFMGCTCAGAIAVPTYPPDPSRLARTFPRLASLIADAGARFALTQTSIRGLVEAMTSQIEALSSLTWLAVEDAGEASREAWRHPDVRPDAVALLQYTSGSTGTPRGVMVSHENLLHNSAAIHRCFGHGADSRGVIWLPPYHDMGLIGGALQPLYGGFPVVLMSPLAFLARPLRWLSAISRYHATTSGGPSFAYDLCVRKISAEQRAGLDLSSWSLAFNGAEPIHPETLDRFAATFASCGFRREAFYPCYGLAEATLIVSGGKKGSPVVVRRFAAAALDRGQAVASEDEAAAEGRALVGCGASLPDQEVRIVDPERLITLPDGQIGEIWVRGPSVACGYWKRDEESAATFQARPADVAAGGYLRTGDLGFLLEGELFVAGRRKDVVIVRGRNIFPQDVERTALGCHAALRPGCAAAFSVEAEGEERLALVLEIDPAKLAGDASALIGEIRRVVAEQHEVEAYSIALLPPGSVPKTSSGKVQRSAARQQLLAGGFAPVAQSILAAPAVVARTAAIETPSRDALLALPASTRAASLVELVRRYVADLLGVETTAVDPARPLTTYGFDSIKAIELSSRVSEELGVELPLAVILDGASAAALADLAAANLTPLPSSAPVTVVPGEDAPLSLEQERLLFLDQLAPLNPAYNIAVAVSLEGRLDRGALARSLATIVGRHAVLRTSYQRRGGEVIQVVAPPDDAGAAAALVEEDAAATPDGEGDAAALRLALAEAMRPFDLQRGPVLRARCLHIGPERHLLVLVVHHIAADGWSMGVLVRELSALYGALVAGRPPELPPLASQYASCAARQRRWIEAGDLTPDLDFWRRCLAGAPPLLELKGMRPRPSAPSFVGARCPVSLDEGLTGAIEKLAASEGATLYMTLLAGFFVLLRQRTGRDDLLVGTDVAGRRDAQAQRLIGLFVNQIVLRVDASGDPTFRAFLGRVRAAALAAYPHDRAPFDKVVEALRPPRDPRYNPLFQIMFVLESAPLPDLTLPGLRLSTVELDDGGSPFDLSVLLAERGGRLSGAIRYNTALFEAETIAALADDYAAVLAAATSSPESTLSALSTLVVEQSKQRKEAQAEALRAAHRERFRALPRR